MLLFSSVKHAHYILRLISVSTFVTCSGYEIFINYSTFLIELSLLAQTLNNFKQIKVKALGHRKKLLNKLHAAELANRITTIKVFAPLL